jgi:1-pyrroline-5-carboxylate dehydrogenase
VAEARLHGTIYGGGHQLTEGALGHGHFVEPTIVELPADHPIWSTELFLPFVALQRIDSFAQALALANASEYGLTAGL